MKLIKIPMKYIVVAPMGDNMDAIFVGVKEFPTEKIILISSEKRKKEADKVKSKLDKLNVPTHVINIQGKTELEIWENTFKAIGNINSDKINNEILVNVGTGDSNTRCAATTAAFTNGIKAFAVSGGKVMMLPFMKFSYYKMIPEKKMEILRNLNENVPTASFKELSNKTKMSLPLISYHINGNLKSEGLKAMGLVEIKEERNKMAIALSTLGRMIVGGYV